MMTLAPSVSDVSNFGITYEHNWQHYLRLQQVIKTFIVQASHKIVTKSFYIAGNSIGFTFVNVSVPDLIIIKPKSLFQI